MSVNDYAPNVPLEPPQDWDTVALDQAEQYGLTTTWPPAANDHSTEHTLNDHISSLAQNLPHHGANIDTTRRWLNAALDFRQTALKHPVAWTGAELHSLSASDLGEYLVECGLGKCQAKEIARDILFARETRAAWMAKIAEMEQKKLGKKHDDYSDELNGHGSIRISSMLAGLFLIVVATSLGVIH